MTIEQEIRNLDNDRSLEYRARIEACAVRHLDYVVTALNACPSDSVLQEVQLLVATRLVHLFDVLTHDYGEYLGQLGEAARQ
jgi:hypothetical protein